MRSRTHWHPSYCRVCGKVKEEVGRISATGKCEPCGKAAMNEAHEQLRAQEGPIFDAWCYGLIEYAHGQLERLMADANVDAGELAA